jgi:hypothetical protein
MPTAIFINRSDGYDKTSKTIEDTYQVNVDAANDEESAKAAVEARPVPDGYVIDSLNASHINRNPLWFEVRVTYRQSTASGGVGADDPLARPSILSASFEEWTEPYDVDYSDPVKPVTNSAGDPFQAYPQRKNGSLVIQITKNFAGFDAAFYDAIKFTTNASPVTIKGTTYAADVLLFLPPTAQEVNENNGSSSEHFFSTTFRLASDVGKHRQYVADRGYREIGDEGPVPIRDGVNGPTEDPWPLDGEGGAKASIDAVPEVLAFVPYRSANWGIDFS